MSTITKTLTAALALAGALVSTGAASAHDWNGGASWQNGGYAYYQPTFGPSPRDRYLAETTCSGQRGFTLENRLRIKVDRGQISPWTAGRIQRAIDGLQFKERHECREGDFRAARNIGQDYLRINTWIDRETGGYRGGWYGR
ncbi:MAG: hypothetical protein ACKVOL_09280 [Novosphingobium sp.]